MKKSLMMLAILGATANAYAVDTGALVGGAIGGAAGAAVGYNVGGKNGAILGGAIGGATGAAVGTSNQQAQAAPVRPAQPVARPVHAANNDDEEGHDHGRHEGHKKHRNDD